MSGFSTGSADRLKTSTTAMPCCLCPIPHHICGHLQMTPCMNYVQLCEYILAMVNLVVSGHPVKDLYLLVRGNWHLSCCDKKYINSAPLLLLKCHHSLCPQKLDFKLGSGIGPGKLQPKCHADPQILEQYLKADVAA